MIPLVSTDTELKILRELVNRTAKKIETENKIKLDYMVGTMIELPRADFIFDFLSSIKALKIASHCIS